MAAREVATTPRIFGPVLLFSDELQCQFRGEGWNPSFDWRVDYSPAKDQKTRIVSNEGLRSFLRQDPHLKDGRYHCNVTFEMEYEGKTTKLCSQTKSHYVFPEPAVDKVTSTEPPVDEVTRQLQQTNLKPKPRSKSSFSTLAKAPKECVKVYNEYAQLDLTTPTLCHAFFLAGSVLSNDNVDWERMEGPAQKLIYADWSDCLGFVKKSAEEELMQPIINEILSEALGEDFPMKKWAKEHWFLVDIKGKKEDCFSHQRPDGVVLSSGTPHTRALLIEEFKVLEGSGDPFVQLLLYMRELGKTTDNEQSDLASRAYPVLLLEMKGKSAKLHAAIRMLDENEEMIIHHCLLAQAEFTSGQEKECAMFLLRLQRGVKELNTFWKNGAECMRFDSDHILPCDCVAELLGTSGSFGFSRHVKRDVFEMSTKDRTETRTVKFSTHRYGQEAHERCAEKGMAPKLYETVHLPLYCSLWVVMMEKLEGYICLDDALRRNLSAAQTKKIKEKMKKALDVLHGGESEKRLAHGDFRSPNVLVSMQEESDDVQVRIIDFDWSGEEGRAIYPNVNVTLNWPEGVECGSPLKVEHDWTLYRAHCHDLDWVARQES